uniref:potassium channel subfamily K member 16-like isoform X2 n=1 Tax=Myxine glutinosa TaxID=7769 RepID=UPI00358EC38C
MIRIAQIIHLWDQNSLLSMNSSSPPRTWSYNNAVFFVTTLVTTVGYGNIVPITTAGKVACYVYASVGIPLNAVIVRYTYSFMLRFKPSCHAWLERKGFSKNSTRWIIAIAFLLWGHITFLALPAVIIHKMEKWNYYDSWYFSFVTLSTIGLGDFVAGEDSYVVYQLAIGFCIPLGMAWLAGTYELFKECLVEEGGSAEISLVDGSPDPNSVAVPSRQKEHNERKVPVYCVHYNKYT